MLFLLNFFALCLGKICIPILRALYSAYENIRTAIIILWNSIADSKFSTEDEGRDVNNEEAVEDAAGNEDGLSVVSSNYWFTDWQKRWVGL